VGDVHREDPSRSGINSEITSTLHTGRGLVFVKGAAEERARKSLHNEAAVNPHVAALAPRLLFDVEAGGWRLLGFEHLDARPVDYSPGSGDLPKLAELVGHLQRTPQPAVVTIPFERRWSHLGDAGLLAGDALLHTDFNKSNVLITEERAYLVDWAWNSRGAAWVDLAFLTVRLVAAGHHPAEAEEWAAQVPAWKTASAEGIDTFATLNLRLWKRAVEREPRPAWIELAATAKTWASYRGL
jgi:hypothetical protein